MSKYEKKRNPPVASSGDDGDDTLDLLTAPGTVVPALEAAGPATASLRQQPKIRWRVVSDQLELLRAMVSQMVELLTATTMAGLTARTLPGREDRPPESEARAGTSASGAATITRATETTRPEAAITCSTGEVQSPDATPVAVDAGRGTERTRRLPPVRKFIMAGGDWSTFT
ncbi:unnamed protein product [Lampetra fluviatilis]